jgi:hypothetical protein
VTRRAVSVPIPSSATLDEVIEAEWARAGAVLDDDQFEQVTKREAWFEDERLGFLTYLRSIIRRPEILAYNDDAVHSCRCADLRFVFNERGEVYPCSECNTRLWELWRGGHLRREHHRCPECTPKGQRTGRASGAVPHEEAREDRNEHEADVVAEELF